MNRRHWTPGSSGPPPGREPASRRGFYHHLDLFYTRVLSWAMSHRRAVVGGAGLVVLATIPIYRATRQELVPGNVDEAEFDVSIDAPEGMSLAAMDEAMREVERELLETRGVTTVLTTAGRSWMGNVNNGSAYVRLKPHEERVFGFGRIGHELANLTPWRAFYGNYSQRDVMVEVRRRLRKFSHLRSSVRNAQSFNFGGGPGDLVLALRGPDVITLLKSLETIREFAVRRLSEAGEGELARRLHAEFFAGAGRAARAGDARLWSRGVRPRARPPPRARSPTARRSRSPAWAWRRKTARRAA